MKEPLLPKGRGRPRPCFPGARDFIKGGGFSLGCPHIIFFFDAKYLEILPVNIIFK
jgi:hypothetical protein